MRGDGGKRGQHGGGVGAADDVRVEDLARVFAKPQPLGEEHEVELAALGGARHVLEGCEVDLAAGSRIAPHRRVVDAWEMRGELDLLGHVTPPRTG